MPELEDWALWKLNEAMRDSRAKRRPWDFGTLGKMVEKVYSYTPSPEEGEELSDVESLDHQPVSRKRARGEDGRRLMMEHWPPFPGSKPLAPDPKPLAAKPERNSDKLRHMVAAYFASYIRHYRKERDFKKFMGGHPEFAVDVLGAVHNGDPVEQMPFKVEPGTATR